MTKKRSGPKIPVAQFIAIIALSVSIFLVVDFGRRAAANYRVQREADRLSQELELARQHQAELLAQRSYIASDLYIEKLARAELKWASPGETVIVVMPTPEAMALGATPQDILEVTTPILKTPAEAWWHLFFGPQGGQKVGG